MSGSVAVSDEFRKEAISWLVHAMKCKHVEEKDESKLEFFCEAYEHHNAYIPFHADQEKYVDVVNTRIRQLSPKFAKYVFSDSHEKRLIELAKKHAYDVAWARIVLTWIHERIKGDTFKADADHARAVERYIHRRSRSTNPCCIPEIESEIIPNIVLRAHKAAKQYMELYLSLVYHKLSNELTSIIRKKESARIKSKMTIEPDRSIDYVSIGRRNLSSMPYCQIPQFIGQFKCSSTVRHSFRNLCEALAVVCHNSDHAREEIMQHAKRFKVDKE